jgi:hypothetical protein
VSRCPRHAAKLIGDQAGQATLEWTLILVVFGLPMIFVFNWLMQIFGMMYAHTAFFQALPFP